MNSANIRKFVLPLIILAGILLRVYWFTYNPSLWNDEVVVANSIRQYSVGQLFTTPLDGAQMAPVGFLLVAKLFGALGGYSELSLRLLSLLCGVAALVAFWRVTRLLFSGVPLIFAVALFSFSGPLIYHSSEVKQYETEVLAAVVILWLAVRLRHGLTAKQVLATGAVGMVCVWFAFSSIFVIGGVFATLGASFFLKKEYRDTLRVMAIAALSLASFVAYYVFVIHKSPNLTLQQSAYEGHFAPWPISVHALVWYVRTAYLALDDPFGVSLDVNLPFLPYSSGLKYAVTLCYPAIILGLFGVYRFWRDDRSLACLLASPLVVALVASLLGKYPLVERHFLFFVPSFCLFLAKAVEPIKFAQGVPRSRDQLALRSLLAWVVLYLVVNLVPKVMEPRLFGGMKHTTMREAIEYIAAHQQKGDKVFLLWNAATSYTYYSDREHLNWDIISGDDPRVGAHSLDEIRVRVQRDVRGSVTGHPRVWFLMAGIYSQITYVDEKGVAHDTNIPTADIYKEVLNSIEAGKITAEFIGHGAAAYLVENGQ